MHRITGLSAAIVSHREWPISKWFYANPLWYYQKKGQDSRINPDRQFYWLVDPELRQICHLLNSAGLLTTPSCQGHFYHRHRFENIWDVLTREALLIRGNGLIVKDSETDKEFLFEEHQYQLPWKSFDDFYAQAADHQGTGYLGILVPRDRDEMIQRFRDGYQTDSARLNEDPQLGEILGGTMFQIILHATGSAHRAEEWRKFTEWVRERVNGKLKKKRAVHRDRRMPSSTTALAPDSDPDRNPARSKVTKR